MRRFATVLVLPILAVLARPVVGDDRPKIRSVTPGSATRGGTVDVTIEGTNLHPYEELRCNRTDISVTPQPGPTSTRLVLRLVIPDGVTAGPVSFSLRTKAGVETWDRFQVKMRTPVVTRVSPTSVIRGGEYDVRLEGTWLAFLGQDTLAAVEPPMTAKVVGKPTDRQLTIHVTVPPDTPVGPRPLTITTTDGKVTTNVNVALAVPSISGVTPAVVARGAAADLVVAGKNLSGATNVALAVPDDAVTVVARGAPTAAAVPLTVTAKPEALPGPRVLVLRTPDGLVTTRFEVTTPEPALVALRPAGTPRGADLVLTPTVERAPGAYALRVVPADPAVTVEAQPAGTWRVRVGADAAPGPRAVVLDHRFGVDVLPFTVAMRTPSVTGLTPAEVAPGKEVDVAVEGLMLEDATVTLAAPDPGVVLSRKGAGVVHVAVAADARPGTRPLVVATADGAAVATLVVTGTAAPAPTIASVLPGRIGRGWPSELTIAGLNLRSGGDQPPTVTATVAGVAVPASVVASTASALRVRVEPAADARAGALVLVVTTAEGVAAATTTVVPAAPAVTGATPASAPRPGEAVVTLVGTHLVGPGNRPPTVALTAPDGTAPIAAVVRDAKPEALVVAIPLDASVAPGARLLVVTTSEGGTAFPFTIPARPPSVEAIEPGMIGIPANVVFTLRGKNLRAPGGKPPTLAVTRLGAPATLRADLLEATDEALTVRIVTTAATPAGTHVLTVKTADGLTGGIFEIVNAPMPTFTAIAPASGPRLATVTVTVEGTGLTGATAVTFAGDGVAAVIQPGGTDTKLLLRVSVDGDAARGPRAVTITAPGGQATNPKLSFTVE